MCPVITKNSMDIQYHFDAEGITTSMRLNRGNYNIEIDPCTKSVIVQRYVFEGRTRKDGIVLYIKNGGSSKPYKIDPEDYPLLLGEIRNSKKFRLNKRFINNYPAL